MMQAEHTLIELHEYSKLVIKNEYSNVDKFGLIIEYSGLNSHSDVQTTKTCEIISTRKETISHLIEILNGIENIKNTPIINKFNLEITAFNMHYKFEIDEEEVEQFFTNYLTSIMNPDDLYSSSLESIFKNRNGETIRCKSFSES